MTPYPIHHLPEEVKEEIRILWGQGTPKINDAAAVAVQHARRVFKQQQVPWDAERQSLLGVAAGRVAEQMRGEGSDAFIQLFERICMSNICTTAVYNSIK